MLKAQLLERLLRIPSDRRLALRLRYDRRTVIAFGFSSFLRSITAMVSLENLVDVKGFEKLRPLYDYLINVINTNIDGDADPPRQERS